jgi:hypothetical protein
MSAIYNLNLTLHTLEEFNEVLALVTRQSERFATNPEQKWQVHVERVRDGDGFIALAALEDEQYYLSDWSRPTHDEREEDPFASGRKPDPRG